MKPLKGMCPRNRCCCVAKAHPRCMCFCHPDPTRRRKDVKTRNAWRAHHQKKKDRDDRRTEV
jgi:hypothetical protein